MIKRTILYRRCWYIKKRNGENIRLYIRLSVILTILLMFGFFANKNLLPNIIDISEIKARALMSNVISSTVNEVFNSKTGYEQLVNIKRSEEGSIILIETDVAKLNSLTSQVIRDVENRLLITPKMTISVPLGAFMGNTIFAGVGPKINVNVWADRCIDVSFESQFLTEGLNQTKHRIVLHIRTEIKVVAPFTGRTIEMLTQIPVMEAIIVGELSEDILKM